ncbi:MAG: hypothetical protein QOH31_1469 [Verrucomicrobiota bacterium]
MKHIFSFAAIILAAALVTSCATEQGYTTTTTNTSNETGAVRTAGSTPTMPNQGPSMMGGAR